MRAWCRSKTLSAKDDKASESWKTCSFSKNTSNIRSTSESFLDLERLQTPNLYDKRIGAKGAESLAEALRVSQMRWMLLFSLCVLPSWWISIDTSNAGSNLQRDRCWRSWILGWSAESQQSEMDVVILTLCVTIVMNRNRHFKRWFSVTTG